MGEKWAWFHLGGFSVAAFLFLVSVVVDRVEERRKP